VSVKAAIILMIMLMLLALGLVLLLNKLCLIIALVNVLLTIAYPFFKRFFVMPQLILGMIFNGILMAFAAVQNALPVSAWILYTTAICWTIAYDTMYAKTDQDDDVKLGLKSSSIFFGNSVNLMITFFQILFFIGLIIVGILNQLHFMYWLSIIVAVGFAIYQQTLIRLNARENNFKAFLNNHWLGFVVFAGILLSLYS
jgi:4-hydroxybenzoate polyprenyltransferase